MSYINSLEYARKLDQDDPLKDFRSRFYIPMINGSQCIYFTGNSLGLQPQSTQDYIYNELEDWANYGVEAHFHGRNPWLSYHEIFPEKLSRIVGSLPEEVVVMNQLTVNLHLLLTTFYRPTSQRHKIICEAKAFPSDQYAMESQVKIHGYDPGQSIVEVTPREGEQVIRHEDILSVIDDCGDSCAVVLFGGVNYYNGQVFDMASITAAAHRVGAYCGFDLAHAAGNIELKLHEWKVDFACWCSYKYLNSGPGGVAGAFIHQRHVTNTSLPRLAGWWGHEKSTRFNMDKGFRAIPTAEGWQVSNAPVLSMAAHKAALDIFDEARMERLIAKSRMLTGYLFFILNEINADGQKIRVQVITPTDEKQRGCQVSMLITEKGKEIYNALKRHGVLSDWREPNVIRIAPVPLYNTFEDVYRFGEIINNFIH